MTRDDKGPAAARINKFTRHPIHLAEERRDESRLRPRVHLFRRAKLLQPAPIQHANAMPQSQRFLAVVRDEQESCSQPGLNILKQFQRLGTQMRIERRKRLVEQHAVRRIDERSGQRDALPLAARQAFDAPSGVLLELDPTQGRRDELVAVAARHTRDREREGDVCRHVEVWEQGVALENRVDRPAIGRHVRAIAPREIHTARLGRFNARHDLEERAFAAAAGTNEHQHLTAGDGQVDALQNDVRTEPLAHAAQLKGRTRRIAIMHRSESISVPRSKLEIASVPSRVRVAKSINRSRVSPLATGRTR